MAFQTTNQSVIEGITLHKVWSNEQGFTIFQFKYKLPKTSEKISCLGTLGDYYDGLPLRLHGTFSEDDKYGKQFKFSSYEIMKPQNKDDIIQYLSSGKIKQCDKITAMKIYDYFGDSTIEILDKESHRLMEIKGIAEKKKKAISESWQAHRDELELDMFLNRFKINIETVNKIKQFFCNDISKLKEELIKNPYQFVYRYDKFNFAVAEHIAKEFSEVNGNTAIRESLYRIECAAFEYVFKRSQMNGDVCCPIHDVVSAISSNLGLPNHDILKALQSEEINDVVSTASNHPIYIDKDISNESIYIYNRMFYDFETKSVEIVQEKLDSYKSNKSISRYRKFNEEQFIELLGLMQTNLNMKYNEEQLQGIKNCLTNTVSIITGGPGTGKTTVIKGIIEILKVMDEQTILLLAPTGKAAKRITESTGLPALTIHRALATSSEGISSYRDNNSDIESLGSAQCVIIDESSMMDLELFSRLMGSINNNNRVVFVGDIFQLPSIGAGNVLKDLISSKKIPTMQLEQIYRQAGGYIIENAYRIKNGKMPLLMEPDSKDFFFVDESSILVANNKISIIDKLIRDILPAALGNNDFHNDLQILAPSKRSELGVKNINKYMQYYYSGVNETLYKKILDDPKNDTYPGQIDMNRLYKMNITLPISQSNDSDEDTFLSVGDKVINGTNNYDKNVFNGEIGIVTKIMLNSKYLDKLDNGATINRDLKDIDYDVYIRFDDREIAFDRDDLNAIQLAYCLTIHKSQGSEYKYLILCMETDPKIMLQRNLLYTGLTRAKKMVILISNVKAIQYAVDRNIAVNRITFLTKRLIESESLLTQMEERGLISKEI